MSEAISFDEAVKRIQNIPSEVNREEEQVSSHTDDHGADDAATDSVDTDEDTDIDAGPDEHQLNTEEQVEDPSDEDVEDSEEQEGEDTPPINAPELWDADKRELFDKLPRELQEYVAAQDAKSRSAVGKHIQEAVEAKKIANQQAKALTEYAPVVEQLLELGSQRFLSKWGKLTQQDWNHFLATDPQNAGLAKAEYEREVQELSAMKAEMDQLDRVRRQQYVEENENLLTQFAEKDVVAKALVDPLTKNEARGAVLNYLTQYPLSQQQLALIGAPELVIAEKARRYDELMANKSKLVNQPKGQNGTPQKQAAPKGTPFRSSAQGAQPQRSEIQRLEARLKQTGSHEDAVALMLAKQKAAAKKRK